MNLNDSSLCLKQKKSSKAAASKYEEISKSKTRNYEE